MGAWQRKFKFLRSMPFEPDPEHCVNFFKTITKKNVVKALVKAFLKQTKETLIMNQNIDKVPQDERERIVKNMVSIWEYIRDFAYGAQVFRENLAVDIEDDPEGFGHRDAMKKKAEEDANAKGPVDCWIKSTFRK